MFKRKSKNKDRSLCSPVELTGFYAPQWKKPEKTISSRSEKNRKLLENGLLPKQSTEIQDTSGQQTAQRTAQDNGGQVLQSHPPTKAESADTGRQALPQLPTKVQSADSGRQAVPQQPTQAKTADTASPHQPITADSADAGHQVLPNQLSANRQDETLDQSITTLPSKVSSSPRTLLPLKSCSTVHQKSRGTVVTSTSFGVADDLECEYEEEMVELEFEVFSANAHDGMTYPSIIRRQRTDTTTSLRIDCSYDL